jgi:hypothetical protein
LNHLKHLFSLTEGSQQGRPAAARKAPAAFTKVVVKGMTRAEMILKVGEALGRPVVIVAVLKHLVRG